MIIPTIQRHLEMDGFAFAFFCNLHLPTSHPMEAKPSTLSFAVVNHRTSPETKLHYQDCCQQRKPYVVVIKSGTRYWKVDYDILPVVIGERFTVLPFSDLTSSFYDQFRRTHKYPADPKHRLGQLGVAPFMLRKEDAIEFAEELYGLLIQLSAKDRELFDKNPVYINETGYNSDGFHVAGYTKELEMMTDHELQGEYEERMRSNPFWFQTHQLILEEMSKRKGLKDFTAAELKKLDAKEKGKLYGDAFLKNLNSQPNKK